MVILVARFCCAGCDVLLQYVVFCCDAVLDIDVVVVVMLHYLPLHYCIAAVVLLYLYCM